MSDELTEGYRPTGGPASERTSVPPPSRGALSGVRRAPPHEAYGEPDLGEVVLGAFLKPSSTRSEAMFNDTKPFFQSKGIIGGGIAGLAGLGMILGYGVSPADTASLTELTMGLISAAGGILAIIGRIRATKRVGL